MTTFRVEKPVSVLPSPLQPNTIYFVRVGIGFDMYVSDSTAAVTYSGNVQDHDHAIADVTGLQTALNAKANLASPALTGTPTAPTQASGDNTTRIATTAFVADAVSALVDTSPAALDTLHELAAALGDDPNFATTMTISLSTKLVKTANLSDLSNKSTARSNLGVAIGSDVQAYDANLPVFPVGVTTAEISHLKGLLATPLSAAQSDTLTKGFAVTPHNNGSKQSGTFTPDPLENNIQEVENTGSHTLAAPLSNCSMCLLYKNGSGAGAVTVSGYTKVTGDDFTTQNGDEFMCFIVKIGTFSLLNVVALQ